MSEVFGADGVVRRAAVGGPDDGQRMAALPCAVVAQRLSAGEASIIGAATAYDFLGDEALLSELVSAGFALAVC
jgi:hypothetical protein